MRSYTVFPLTSSLSLIEWPVTDLVQGRVNMRLTWPVTDQPTLVKDKGQNHYCCPLCSYFEQDATFNPLPGWRGQILHNYLIFNGQFTGHFGSNRQFRVFVNGERLNHLTDYITRPMPGGYTKRSMVGQGRVPTYNECENGMVTMRVPIRTMNRNVWFWIVSYKKKILFSFCERVLHRSHAPYL